MSANHSHRDDRLSKNISLGQMKISRSRRDYPGTEDENKPPSFLYHGPCLTLPNESKAQALKQSAEMDIPIDAPHATPTGPHRLDSHHCAMPVMGTTPIATTLTARKAAFATSKLADSVTTSAAGT